MPEAPALSFQPAIAERWADLEALFGPRGACFGCWCMFHRLRRSVWQAQQGEANRQSMKSLVEMGNVPGLIAYDGDTPVGWVSVAPRDCFPALATSRILKPVDDLPVWSITCFFILKPYRNRGLSITLLNAASAYVAQQGGTVLEGYPVEPKKERYPSVYAWTGFARAFIKAGFSECARRSPTRPIMRKRLSKD